MPDVESHSHSPARRVVIVIAQGCFLGLLAGALVGYWRQQPKQEIIDDAIADQIEEHGDTYVPVHSGVIEHKTVHQLVSGYAKITSTQFMEIHLLPTHAARARLGQTAMVGSASIGTVTLVKPESVEVSFSSGVSLPANQVVRASIVVDEHADALTVPASSIVSEDNGQSAIAMLIEDGRWSVMVPVQVGIREGDVAEITGNDLKAGQEIVTEGTYGLIRRTRLKLLKD